MKPGLTFTALVLTLCVLLARPSAVVAGRPNVFRRHRIQQMINRGNGFSESARQERQEEMKWRRAWQQTGDPTALDDYRAHHDARLAWEESLRVNRNAIIDSVDAAYDCGVPPGTDVQYDPNCGSGSAGTLGGYCSPRCYIRICEPSFDDPDLVAAVKKHEATHAKQKADGRWGPGNVPTFCSRLLHELEAEAYNAMLEAHSDGDILLPPWWWSKLKRAKDLHVFARDFLIGSEFEDKKLHAVLPGDTVIQDTKIVNDSDEAGDVYGFFYNEAGWLIEPPGFSFFLESEQERTFEISVAVPPDAEAGLGNEVFCNAYLDFGGVPADSSWDFFFMEVTATVDVLPGPDVVGVAGDSAEFHFTVANVGEATDSVEVHVTSLMGWPISEDSWTLELNPSDSVDVVSAVTLPSDEPFAADLIACRAVSLTVPGQADSNEIYASVETRAGVGPGGQIVRFALMPNSPNPFSSSTLISFSIPSPLAVDLRIFDVRGRLVRTVVGPDSGILDPGIHTYVWDGRDHRGRRVASGIYFSRLDAGGRRAARKVVMLR